MSDPISAEEANARLIAELESCEEQLERDHRYGPTVDQAELAEFLTLEQRRRQA